MDPSETGYDEYAEWCEAHDYDPADSGWLPEFHADCRYREQENRAEAIASDRGRW